MMLWRALQVQRRVVGALFMREIQIRWGRRNLGFAWIIAEPLLFAFPVIIMWSFIRDPYEHGVPLVALVWSGYLPLLMFRHTTSQALYVVRSNGAMLYHRAVTPMDLVLGRSALEMMGALAATLSSFIILYVLGQLEWPHNFSLVLVGLFYMAWWAMAVALLVAAASERTDIVEHIWQPVSYMYLPLSGFLYMADWLPMKARYLALCVMPSLHAYEMIRAGLWGNRIATYYDIPYVTLVLAVLTIIGLWVMRGVRQHLQLEH